MLGYRVTGLAMLGYRVTGLAMLGYRVTGLAMLGYRLKHGYQNDNCTFRPLTYGFGTAGSRPCPGSGIGI